MAMIEKLSVGIGPRRPTSPAERAGAESVAEELRDGGVDARLEGFKGYSSFAYPFSILLGLGVLPSLLPAAWRRRRLGSAAAAAGILIGEGSLRAPWISRLLACRESQNVVATLEPSGPVTRTIVLSCHLDTSRSGLMFHRRFVDYLGRWISLQGLAVLAQAPLEWLLGQSRAGRWVLRVIRLIPLWGLAVLAEREFLGVEVQGANDNASGCGVVASLILSTHERALDNTRVIGLFTGCEESGTLGVQEFLASHDSGEWIFINFDNVGGEAPLRYLTREGVMAKFDADPKLTCACEQIAASRPELNLSPEPEPAGLTYDSTPVLARGGRALTISAQDGYIPDLHCPTDTIDRVSRQAVGSAIEIGRELLAAAERGELD